MAIPVWLRGEFNMLLQHRSRVSIAMPCAYDGGTNALLMDLRRVSGFEFQCGADSAWCHRQWCRAVGTVCIVANLPFICRDVDILEVFLLLHRSGPVTSHS